MFSHVRLGPRGQRYAEFVMEYSKVHRLTSYRNYDYPIYVKHLADSAGKIQEGSFPTVCARDRTDALEKG